MVAEGWQYPWHILLTQCYFLSFWEGRVGLRKCQGVNSVSALDEELSSAPPSTPALRKAHSVRHMVWAITGSSPIPGPASSMPPTLGESLSGCLFTPTPIIRQDSYSEPGHLSVPAGPETLYSLNRPQAIWHSASVPHYQDWCPLAQPA